MAKASTHARDKSVKNKAELARQERISAIADETLSFFAETAEAAEAKLGERRSTGPQSLAAINTLTSVSAIQTLDGINAELRHDLIQLANEPAIARLALRDEDGKESVYFIARAGTLPNPRGKHLMASYRSPLGRLAALPVGAEQ